MNISLLSPALAELISFSVGFFSLWRIGFNPLSILLGAALGVCLEVSITGYTQTHLVPESPTFWNLVGSALASGLISLMAYVLGAIYAGPVRRRD